MRANIKVGIRFADGFGRVVQTLASGHTGTRFIMARIRSRSWFVIDCSPKLVVRSRHWVARLKALQNTWLFQGLGVY